MSKIEVKLPYGETVVRSIRNEDQVLIYGIKYRIPKNANSIIDYNQLEVITNFEDVLVLAFKKATESSELSVQINDIDVTDIYNTEFPATYSLTLDYLIEEAEEVLNKYLTSGWSQNEDLDSNNPEIRKRARKDINKLENYINRFEAISNLLNKNNKYKNLAILPCDFEGVDYIIYPPQLQEKVIRMEPVEVYNSNKIKTI